MILFRIYETRAQDKTKQYYCCFLYFIQLYLKTDIALIALRFGFRVQINAEFPRQVMNFPIKCMKGDIGSRGWRGRGGFVRSLDP